MPSLREIQLRHAKHYEVVLRAVNELYLQGGEAIGRAIALLDIEWSGDIPKARINAEIALDILEQIAPSHPETDKIRERLDEWRQI